jgi:hypothetical protein
MPTAPKKTTESAAPDTEQVPPPVHEVWSNVMNTLLGLGKHEQHDSPGARFNYRGIDALMNAVGPVLRQHRALIIPTVVGSSRRDVQTSTGKPSTETTVEMQYTIVGPAGDIIVGSACGEAMDSGDKGTAKAQSVAFRVFLLQSLCLPTDEPDPDSEAYQRSQALTPMEMAQQSYDRLAATPTYDVVLGGIRWCEDRKLMDLPVTDPDGNSLPLRRAFDLRLEALDPTRFAERQASVDKALGGEQS